VFGSQRIIEDLLLSMASSTYLQNQRVIITNKKVSVAPDGVSLFYIGSDINEVRINKTLHLITMVMWGLAV